jgi:hypothetical protein
MEDDRTDSWNMRTSGLSSGSRMNTISRKKAHMTFEPSHKSVGRGIRIAVKIALLLGAVVFLNYSMGWFANLVTFQMWPQHANIALFLLFSSIVSYILLLAIPFLPGIEAGFMLMAMLGTKGIILVYLCTVLSLSLSFFFGRLLPPRYLTRTLGWFQLNRARDLVTSLESLDTEERLRFLLRSAPLRIVPFLLRHRYLIIGIMFNIPGNALIGGGGGIGLIAGMSRLFPFPKYLLLICLAITPGPILFLLRDILQ